LKFSIDTDLLGLVRWDGTQIDLSILTTEFRRLPSSALSVLDGWTGNLWAARNSDGSRLLLLVEPSRTIDQFGSPKGYSFSDMTTLQSLRLALKPGKSLQDLDESSIRLMSAEELHATNQDEQIVLHNGRAIVSIFGSQSNGTLTPKNDIGASDPVFAMVSGNQDDVEVPITTLQIATAQGAPAAAMVTVARNRAVQFKVIINVGASSEGISWTTSNSNLATVDANGLVTTRNTVGNVTLTARDQKTGSAHSIVLRIS